MTWVNVYSTNETDIEKLEAQFLEKSEGWKESIDRLNNSTLIEGSIDKSDYEKVVEESGFSKEEIKAQVENEEDMTELPYGHYKIKLGNSKIHGKGLFATSLIEAGDTICPARIKGLRTIAGRFTNHSKTPNAKMFQGVDHEIELVALKEIKGCKGGLDGEEITIDYREALKLNLEIGNMEVLCQE